MNIDVGDDQAVIHVFLRRVREGIRVDVKVAKEVEDFFRRWSNEATMDVSMYGRMWLPAEKEKILRVWNTMPLPHDEHSGYDINSAGQSLSDPQGAGVNVSFLRMVDASKGVSFIIEDVVSRDGLEKLAQRIRVGCGRFYEQLMKPATLSISVHTEVITEIGGNHA